MPERPGGVTPSQTVGPYFAYCLTPSAYPLAELVTNDLVTEDAPGERIRIEGRVIDGDGLPVTDAMIEIWQADGNGRYAGTGPAALANIRFKGFGRAETDEQGRFSFTTVKPGPVPGADGAAPQAPHINVGIFARGILRRLFTRIYFADETAGNARDPILALVPEEARPTLFARREDREGRPVYLFDIHLQGERETVFFEA